MRDVNNLWNREPSVIMRDVRGREILGFLVVTIFLIIDISFVVP